MAPHTRPQILHFVLGERAPPSPRSLKIFVILYAGTDEDPVCTRAKVSGFVKIDYQLRCSSVTGAQIFLWNEIKEDYTAKNEQAPYQ